MTDRTVTLVGGPLDGMRIPHPEPDSPDPGAYMIVPGSLGRAAYEPEPGGDPDRWHFHGWIGGEGVPEGDDLEEILDELGPTAPPPDAAELLRGLDEIAREQDGRGEVL